MTARTAETRASLFAQDARTRSRNAAEKRFRIYGASAITIALLALVWLLISIFGNGTPAFRQTFLDFPVTLNADVLDKAGTVSYTHLDVYKRQAHIGVIPGLKEYVEFFLSDDMAGVGGALADYGLVPDPELAATQAAVAAETVMGPLLSLIHI